MTSFLLELQSEEIPARMQAKARADLTQMFTEACAKAGLSHGAITSYATPRRIALLVADVAEATPAVSEERKGPRANAPERALAGFLRSTGLTREQLVERDGVFFAVIERAGRPAAEALSEIVPAIVRGFPWPKSMRWGAASIDTASLRWVRPLERIVALLGADVVSFDVAGVASGRATIGHRFHHRGEVELVRAEDYAETLRTAHVIVDQDERAAIIRERAAALAEEAGLELVEDEGLVLENAGLTEWPVPLLGRFDPSFLAVPQEVIQLTARVNQKYFVCRDGAGQLANAFVCTANIEASDGGAAVIAGNEKVLAARLSDAGFFWEQDLKVPLEEQAKKLDRIVFHEKLGSVADKVDRVAKLAEELAATGVVPGCDPALARRAAALSKADLVTGMVGEFPELQGTIGGYLALAQGEHPSVAAAIRDHYKPVGPSDAMPTEPITIAVALADKMDSIGQFFAIDEKPTGSRDPFALRRSALGMIRLVLENAIRLPVSPSYADFVADRLKVQQREAGVRHDLIDAVFALGEDDLVRLLARVHALQGFIGTDDGANLLRAYKRSANILKQAEGDAASPLPLRGGAGGGVSPAGAASDDSPHPYPSSEGKGLDLAPEEAVLLAALDDAEPRAREAVAAEDFTAAMAALASLRAPVDAFFEAVMVNDPDPAVRTRRLALLARLRDAVHGVADFSKIEG